MVVGKLKNEQALGFPFSRELPFSLEAEKSVLAALFLSIESFDLIADLICSDDFYYKPHRIIFKEISDLYSSGKLFDLLILHDHLSSKNLLEQVGGVPYLLELQENVCSIGFLLQHAKIVREKSLFRGLILSCAEVITRCYETAGKTSEEILDYAEKQVFNISSRRVGRDFVSLSSVLKNTFKKISDISASKGDVTGIPTGFLKFDTMTTGFQAGDLLILAARPAMGKTALALNFALNAWKHGYEVGIFSLEMPSEQLALRMIAAESGIPHHKIRTGNIGSEEWLELTNAAAELDEAKIFIDDSASISIMDLRTKARRLKLKYDIKLLIVDYLQLLTIDHKVENRTQEIAMISRSLKALAKELNIPILALSQLSRSLESRMDKRPLLSDLRESGSIEQDADVVFFIYRDVVYHPDTDNANIAEIIVGKQRNGPIGTVNVLFDGALTKFFDMADE